MIKDIRGSTKDTNTTEQLINEIIAKAKIHQLPTMILYDQKGLEIFDKITYHEDYYLTNSEIDILETFADDIVRDFVNEGDVLIELGVGAMRKTKLLLDAIQKSGKRITYYAVDLEQQSLKDSLEPLQKRYPTIQFVGLWGTYHDSLAFVQKNVLNTRKMFLWLGSSIGNLTREEAREFLKTFSAGMNDGDLFLCGIDRRNEPKRVGLAYNDKSGLTRDFALNGLDHINRLFGFELINPKQFEYVSIYNDVDGRHEAYYRPISDQHIVSKQHDLNVTFKKGELINFEYSYKYSMEEVLDVVKFAGLSHLGKMTDKAQLYDLHIFKFSTPETENPSLTEWEELWKASTILTTCFISPSRLLHKPIALRHPYIFYLGHLPAFLDIQVSKVVGNQTEPLYYSEIFERGIDPVMEDPSQCHAHSKVPDQWPTLDEITAYKNRVHQRIRELLRTNLSKRLQRVLNMCYEHEAMHIETLLYMYVQDSGIEPNRYLPKPIWNPTKVSEAMFVQVPEMTISMGLNDPESGDIDPSSPTSFGWDNEKPEHQVVVPSFEMQHRPVTNQEYFDFLTLNHFDAELVPESWSTLNEKWYIKTVYGLVDLAKGYDWPVFASNFQAQLYAKAKQASLPTEAQLVAARKFVNADDGNHSFQHFTPTPVQEYNGSITDLVGSGWEWSRTLFVPFDGFVQSELYPGYSADFFDEKHMVCLGGSWATLSRIASRHSFRNWYQTKYPFVFAKFRLVKNK